MFKRKFQADQVINSGEPFFRVKAKWSKKLYSRLKAYIGSDRAIQVTKIMMQHAFKSKQWNTYETLSHGHSGTEGSSNELSGLIPWFPIVATSGGSGKSSEIITTHSSLELDLDKLQKMEAEACSKISLAAEERWLYPFAAVKLLGITGAIPHEKKIDIPEAIFLWTLWQIRPKDSKAEDIDAEKVMSEAVHRYGTIQDQD